MVKKSINILREFSIPLILGVIIAIIWANKDNHGYQEAIGWSPFGEGSGFTLHFMFNDIFMIFFFGIATKEITESCLPGGDLNPLHKAINPLLATVGGVLGPITVYFTWIAISGDSTISRGWGIPTATDIALAWLVARMIFGKGHPAVSFLLLLAIADDGVGLGIIAVAYPDPHHPVEMIWMILIIPAMFSARNMRKLNVKSWIPYILGSGAIAWYALYMSHLHPALALVFIVPFMPHASRDAGLFADGEDRDKDTLNRFEHTLKPYVDFGLFGFGLMNAGVELGAVGNATWGVMLALIVGKTLGVASFSLLAEKLGFPRPNGMKGVTIMVTGMIAGLGLTVALFVAGVAFTDVELQSAAKMGALFSVAVIPAVLLVAYLGKVGRFKKVKPDDNLVSDVESIDSLVVTADKD